MFTTPLSILYVAETGHTCTQGGFSHCMQGRGTFVRVTFGNSPCSSSITTLYETPGGVRFSALHATVQESHPTHFWRSMTMPHVSSPAGASPSPCSLAIDSATDSIDPTEQPSVSAVSRETVWRSP